jgi:hypothetical protein
LSGTATSMNPISFWLGYVPLMLTATKERRHRQSRQAWRTGVDVKLDKSGSIDRAC